MDKSFLANLYKDLSNDEVAFAYSGSFSDSITVRLIDLARYNFDSRGANAGLKNKVSFLMGECYQNIVRHGIKKSDSLQLQKKSNIFFLRSINDCYYITSANQVENNAIAELKTRVDIVNSLTADELKELQKQVIMKGELTEKGGAGIGIILMARKTGQKLDYFFEKINNKISIFYLQVKFQNLETSDPISHGDVSLKSMIDFHDTLVDKGILIIHKGDFSKETFLPVIKMIEGNLEDKFEQNFTRTKLYRVSVELLQNISIHGLKQDGINQGLYTLGNIDENFIIGSGNLIDNQKVEALKQHLEQLEGLSKNELDKLYKEKLRLVIDENDEGVGLGLIDIFRNSISIEYSISPFGDVSLFSLVVKI